MSTAHDRKRKRDVADDGAQVANVKTDSQLQMPPILLSVHGVKLSRSLNLSAYHKQKPKAGNAFKDEIVLHGENDRMEYDAAELDESRGLSHYVGVYNKATNTVEVYPAPLLHLTAQIKSIKDKEIPDRLEETNYMASRHALGSAFGTKKSRKQLLDREINAVTAEALGSSTAADVTSVITSAVQEAVASMPTRPEEEKPVSVVGNRKYIPVPNTAEGTAGRNIYKLDDLVTRKELESCNIYDWEEAVKNGGEAESSVSPHYVGTRISAVIRQDDNTNTRILRYVEHIIAFYKFMASKRSNMATRRMITKSFESDDRCITEGLISRYTESMNQQADSRVMSKVLKTKLQCYMLILCLKMEYNAAMDLFDLVQDLQVDRRDFEQICREVGAKVKPFSDLQISTMKISKAEAKERRLVILSLPLQFPKEKKFRRR